MKDLNNAHKKKKKLKEEISEKFVEKILDMVNQNVQDALRNFLRHQKQYEMIQKQIREFRQDLNKHQSETKDTIKREIHELKRTTKIIKEELITDLENLRRKNQTEILETKKSL
jgi:uncharacterized phage infection (PIP) family protein YhgE